MPEQFARQAAQFAAVDPLEHGAHPVAQDRGILHRVNEGIGVEVDDGADMAGNGRGGMVGGWGWLGFWRLLIG